MCNNFQTDCDCQQLYKQDILSLTGSNVRGVPLHKVIMQYGNIQFNLFGNKTCDDFLPPVPTSKSRQNKRVSKINTKTFGSTTSNTTVNRYPWLCSLKESGFRGRHRCGVTLLAGNCYAVIQG